MTYEPRLPMRPLGDYRTTARAGVADDCSVTTRANEPCDDYGTLFAGGVFAPRPARNDRSRVMKVQ